MPYLALEATLCCLTKLWIRCPFVTRNGSTVTNLSTQPLQSELDMCTRSTGLDNITSPCCLLTELNICRHVELAVFQSWRI
jgi:hypothetical protein